MNGPEHYAEAQRLLMPEDGRPHENDLLRALGHAVLALTAATIENDAELGLDLAERAAWRRAGAVK